MLMMAPPSSSLLLPSSSSPFMSSPFSIFAQQERAVVHSNPVNMLENVQPAHAKLHRKMKKKELVQQQKRSFRSHMDAAYQSCRSTLVDWVCQVCEACGLKNITTHEAVGFIDMLLDITPVDKSRLQLVAIACILISAKIEEQEEKVPRVHSLTNMCGNIFSRELVLKMESWILNAFRWEMVIITTIHFLEYYQQASFFPSELAKNPHIHNFENCKTRICKTADFLVDLSEHHSYFRQYLPSVVAAASIAAARQMLSIQPAWSESLQSVSSYSADAIQECTSALLSCYHQTFPQE